MDREQIRAENDKKKKYLWGYRRHSRRIKRIEAEIEEIRSMKENPSLNTDGMPAGTDQNDLSNWAAALDKLEREQFEEGVAQVKIFKDISWRIKQLKDENERDVMFYRYIKGLEFWEIAVKMDYTERWIHELHGRALKNLKIAKECSSLQSKS